MNNEIEDKEPERPNNDGIDFEGEWDIDPAKACDLQDGECEACS